MFDKDKNEEQTIMRDRIKDLNLTQLEKKV
jgi:hypothetical protein